MTYLMAEYVISINVRLIIKVMRFVNNNFTNKRLSICNNIQFTWSSLSNSWVPPVILGVNKNCQITVIYLYIRRISKSSTAFISIECKFSSNSSCAQHILIEFYGIRDFLFYQKLIFRIS